MEQSKTLYSQQNKILTVIKIGSEIVNNIFVGLLITAILFSLVTSIYLFAIQGLNNVAWFGLSLLKLIAIFYILVCIFFILSGLASRDMKKRIEFEHRRAQIKKELTEEIIQEIKRGSRRKSKR